LSLLFLKNPSPIIAIIKEEKRIAKLFHTKKVVSRNAETSTTHHLKKNHIQKCRKHQPPNHLKKIVSRNAEIFTTHHRKQTTAILFPPIQETTTQLAF